MNSPRKRDKQETSFRILLGRVCRLLYRTGSNTIFKSKTVGGSACFAPFKYFVLIAAAFLFVFGILPIGVSALYGGNPPPHLARLLDKQMDTFSTVAVLFFRAFTRSSEEKPKNEQHG